MVFPPQRFDGWKACIRTIFAAGLLLPGTGCFDRGVTLSTTATGIPFSSQVPEERLREGLGFAAADGIDVTRPWRVELDHEVRSAVLVPPGEPYELELRVPSRPAVLHFGYGLWERGSGQAERARRPVLLHVAAMPPRGSGTATLFVAQTLFTAALVPSGRPRENGWIEGEVDLGALAGQRVRLRFESDVPGPAPLGGIGGGGPAPLGGIGGGGPAPLGGIGGGGPAPLGGIGGGGTAPSGGTAHAIPVVANAEVRARGAGRGLPNVVLISLDGLRADRLSLYGYSKLTTPSIDAWAGSGGAVFLKTVAASPWTLPSHVSMLSARDALHHGVNYPDTAVPRRLATLPELLREAGYRTVALTGGGFLRPELGVDRGFDRFRWWPSGTERDEIAEHVDTALDWIDRLSGRPFFLFFQTQEIQAPLSPREPYFSKLGGRQEDLAAPGLDVRSLDPDPGIGFQRRFRAVWRADGSRQDQPLEDPRHPVLSDLYDSGVAYADAQIGRLLEGLRQLDLDSNTLVVITSGHGEWLGENDLVGHTVPGEPVLLVPLVMRFPGRLPNATRQEAARQEATRVTAQVRSVDVVPTILELAGMAAPAGIDGVSLISFLSGPAATRASPPDSPRGGQGLPAWTYAGWANHGLSLRLADSKQYAVNDSPWQPICGQETVHLFGEDPDDLRHLEDLRRQAQRYLRAYSSGLGIRLVNSGDQTMGVTLAGDRQLRWELKSLEPTCAGLSWNEEAEAVAALRPGESATLIWHNSWEKQIKVTVWIEGADRRAATAVIAPALFIDEAYSLLFQDEGWSGSQSLLRGEDTGVELRWQGRRPEG